MSHVWRNLFKLRDKLKSGRARDNQDDSWRWTLSSTGDYTTSSGYDLIYKERLEKRGLGGGCSNPAEATLFWRRIWKAGLPPKIQMTVWRFAHDSLPDFHNLWKRGCKVNTKCIFCGFKIESSLHLIRDCWWGREAGRRMGIAQACFDKEGNNPADWIHHCSSLLDRSSFGSLMCLIWALWICRNERIYEDRSGGINETVQKAMSVLRQAERGWHSVFLNDHSLRARMEENDNLMRFHCDGSWDKRERVAGWAVVAYQYGTIVRVQAGWKLGAVSSAEAEGLAMKKGMDLAEELTIHELIFLTDCASVFWSLFSGGVGGQDAGEWLQCCLRKLEKFPKWKVGHVLREENESADRLCKKAGRERWEWRISDAIPWV